MASKAKPKGKASNGKKMRTTGAKKAVTSKNKYGFRTGTLTAKAAALYARAGGATRGEVIKACGGPQRNLLDTAKERGFKVRQSARKCAVTGKTMTAYQLT